MRKIITVTAILLTLQTIVNRLTAQSTKLKQLNWLTGKWVMQVKKGTSYEIWGIVNDSTYQSHCFIITPNGDTIPQESAKLVCRSGICYYIPTVPNQNNGHAVTFKITALSKKGFVAENPEHDFPQRITYTLKSADKLFASVDGKYNNKFMKEEYNMTRQ